MAMIMPAVTRTTPASAAAVGISDKSGIAASVVTQGTAAVKSAAPGPPARIQRPEAAPFVQCRAGADYVGKFLLTFKGSK